MNHLTLYGYEEDGELILYRCPEESCGSTGPKGSRCPAHDPPTGDGAWGGPKRKPVRVPGVGEQEQIRAAYDAMDCYEREHGPGVGEEPEYTLEQVRAGVLADETVKAVAELYRPAGTLAPPPLFMLNIENQVRRDLNRALDHFTQQPAGAEGFLRFPSAPPVSADSDGNQQPQGGIYDFSEQDDLEIAAEGIAHLEEAGVKEWSELLTALRNAGWVLVAEGDSVQCGGVALAQLREGLRGEVERLRKVQDDCERSARNSSASPDVRSIAATRAANSKVTADNLDRLLTDEDEAVALRRELLLTLGPNWQSTRDLAEAVGYTRYQSLDPVRITLYELRHEGRVDLRRRNGSGGYLWRLAAGPTQQSKSGEGR